MRPRDERTQVGMSPMRSPAQPTDNSSTLHLAPARTVVAPTLNDAMAGTGPSLNEMPADVLKEIVEVVARISVKNRGARNEICSLSLVNKRLYALAIQHIFRVINAQKKEHYFLEMPYTSMPPSALQHTR